MIDMFQHSGVPPKVMSQELLKKITNNFSKELGRGTFGIVYKGVVDDGEEVAVKVLQMQGYDHHEQFIKEFENLWRLRHQNIVQLLGYCYETQSEYVNCGNGKFGFADKIYVALCFEYMHKGSLREHLRADLDEDNGHDWQTHYKIIKGICEGLKYLHEGLESPMYHLDLKPENILLDKTMVPKIADFGLSKLVHNDQTKRTLTPKGTSGYMPPEFIEGSILSKKFDIFSLGVVMIRIMAGYKGYFKKADMSSQEFIDLVQKNWRNRLQATSGSISLEAECHQVRRCIEIAVDCVCVNREERPNIGDIVHWLNETELMISDTISNDETIKGISNVTSNIGGPSMENPITVPVTPKSQETVYSLKLYMHQTVGGPNQNQVNIANLGYSQMFGCTNVHDYPIYDSIGPSAKIVARAQGLHTKTSLNYGDWLHWSSIVFSDERLKGSSFVAIGNQNEIQGEWVIVGGTGVFTFAQGAIKICRIPDSGSLNIKEISIRALGSTGLTTPIDIEPFKDNTMNVYTNAASNVFSPSMANNPQSVPVTPQSQRIEYNRILYMQQIISGPDYNQVTIADPRQPHMFGYTNVHDYPIYDSLGPGGKLVARAQGLHTETSMNYDGWFHWSKVAFDYERFQGSSFNALGDQEGEWAIVGGTGVFTFAQGTITTRRVQESGSSNIKEIHIRALCWTPTTTPIEIELFKDNMIYIDSDTSSDVCNRSMANPQSAPVTAQPKRTEYNRILYMHQIINGPDYNQVNIADPREPQMFGYTNVHDYPIYDSLGPGKKIVARAQGLHTKTSMKYDGWFHWSSVVFTDESFKGSSLKAIGNQEGEWAIVGGTGEFTFAQGTITTYRIQDTGFSNIKEIRIHALLWCTPN